MSNLTFHPVIPIPFILVLVALSILGVWLSLLRCSMPPRGRWGVFGLRVAGILLLAALLFQPEHFAVTEKTERPVLAVLVDASASMLDSPAKDPETRAKAARALLDSRAMSALDDRFTLQWFEFGADLEDARDPRDRDILFNAPRTHVHRALNTLQTRTRGANLAGVLLLSDGLDQSEEPLSPEAERLPVLIPELEPVLPPKPTSQQETWIADLTAPKLLVVHWKGQVDVVVKRSVPAERMSCTVHLYRGTERIRTSYLVFEPGDLSRPISFGIEPMEVGRQAYRVEIEPGADTRTDNNSRAFLVDVTDPQNRVLYLEGTLRYEFKFLKRALLKEKNFQLSAFVQSAPGLFINFNEAGGSATSELPELTETDTVKYRAIILGEMGAAALNEKQQAAIESFVDKGGGLLFIGGRKAYGPEGWPASPIMSKLLPFTSTPGAKMNDGRFSVAVEPLGHGHSVLTGIDTDGAFPPVLSIWGPVVKQPAATPLLAVADGSPLLLTSRYGKGKVAAVLSDSLWRWQLGAPQLDDSKSLYEQFFSQTTYWLAPQEKQVDDKPELQIITASGNAELRQQTVIGAVMGDRDALPEGLSLEATIKTPDGRELRQAMVAARLGEDVGLSTPVWGWRTDFVPHIAGAYTVTVRTATGSDSASVDLLVAEPQLEHTHDALNRDYLQRLAERTGGAWFKPADLAEAARALPYNPLSLRTTDQSPLWNRPWILVVLLALFIGEWYLRSRLDLV